MFPRAGKSTDLHIEKHWIPYRKPLDCISEATGLCIGIQWIALRKPLLALATLAERVIRNNAYLATHAFLLFTHSATASHIFETYI